MLNEFESWVREYTEFNICHNESELSENIVIDFDNESYICRFTLWDDLSCMSEIMDVDTGTYKLNKRNEFSTFNELLEIFNVFIKNIN